MKKIELPKPIVNLIENHQSGGASKDDCIACASSCCSQGGFAILENVVLIYGLYKHGGLKRADYEYESDLNFEGFVKKYFDVWFVKVGRRKILTTFHMKSISSDGNLISIPGASDYYKMRAELFHANPWLNKGCVFLNKRIDDWPRDDKVKDRLCILHDPEYMKYVTAKPVHCIFYICLDAVQAKIPSEQETRDFLALLAKYFPDSKKRLEAMLDEKEEKKEA